MKPSKLILIVALVCLCTGSAWGQLDTLYEEYFDGGAPALTWFDPWSPGGTIGVQMVQGNWVGVVSNALSGGGVGTALSGTSTLGDYEIQADIYNVVSSSAGPYNGIVARWDSVGGNTGYSFRSDFDEHQRLQLRRIPLTSSIAEWSGAQIPGGVPTQSGWHNMRMKLEGDQIWVYWEGVELSGCPYTDDALERGFFGAYVFLNSGVTQTLCDNFIVLGEAGAQPFDLDAREQHLLDDTLGIISGNPAVGQTIYFQLLWDAFNGSTTSPPFDIRLNLDGTSFYNITHLGVEPNTSDTTITNTPWTATLGWHHLEWILDVDNTVPESNEANNTLIDSFQVLPATAYDLSADSSWSQNATGMNDTLTIGDPVRFGLWWSVPSGSGGTGPFGISLHFDGEPYWATFHPGVTNTGNQPPFLCPVVWTAEEGFHYYEWELDTANVIQEFNELNNYVEYAVWIVPPTGVVWNPWFGAIPNEMRFDGVYPNPFNPTVTLRFITDAPGILKISVYDVAGREVTVLADRLYPTGMWEVTWEAEGISAGTYYAVLEGNGKRDVQPLLLVK